MLTKIVLAKIRNHNLTDRRRRSNGSWHMIYILNLKSLSADFDFARRKYDRKSRISPAAHYVVERFERCSIGMKKITCLDMPGKYDGNDLRCDHFN